MDGLDLLVCTSGSMSSTSTVPLAVQSERHSSRPLPVPGVSSVAENSTLVEVSGVNEFGSELFAEPRLSVPG